MSTQIDKLSLSWWPFLKDIKGYDTSALRRDIWAGITVAIFAIPQAMAYAILAGVPPVYGLYSSIVVGIIASLWGSSERINSGPTNSASLLTAAAMFPFAATPEHLKILFLFTLMVGVIRLTLGLFRCGRLVQYVPESAFIGFTVGAGLLIAAGQLHYLLGLNGSTSPWFLVRMQDVFSQASNLNIVTLDIGILTLAIMLMFSSRSKKFPIALIAIIIATLASVIIGDRAEIKTVADIASITSALPHFVLPAFSFQLVVDLFPAAFAVAIIGLIEAVSVGQVLALKNNHHLNYNQEFVGQGVSMIAGGFFQCIPGSGSFSRSALMEETGAATRFANVVFGLTTAMALLLIPHLLNLIPIAALAGLLLFIGYKLIDFKKIRQVINTSPEDAMVMLITFLVTVLFKIEYGIYVGIILSALLFLKRASKLKLVELFPVSGDRFDEKPYTAFGDHAPSDLVALGVGGDLFYGKSVELRECLQAVVDHQKPRVIILRARRAYSVDYSCISALTDFADAFHAHGGVMFITGVREDFHTLIKDAGIGHAIDEAHVFPQESSLFSGLRNACKEAYNQLPENALLSEPWEKYKEEINA